MSNNSYSQNKKGNKSIPFLCNFLFAAFSFIYLFYFQRELLFAFHNSISRTNTTYSPLVNAIVLTLVLLVIRWGINQFVGLKGIMNSISYFPVFLLLGVLTDFNESIFELGSINHIWKWLLPLILILYTIIFYSFRFLFCLWIEKKRDSIILYNASFFFMTAFSIMTILIGNSNIIFHHLVETETAISVGDNQKAAIVGNKSLESTRAITVLKNFAIAKEGKMGDLLFSYPQNYGTEGLYLNENKRETQKINNDSIAKFMRISNKLNNNLFASLYKIADKNKRAADYYLSYLLLSKDLKNFSNAVLKYYQDTEIDQLPRYYKEALLLNAYNEQKELPEINDEDMSKHFEEFMKEKNSDDDKLLINKDLYINFRDTYWWYYTNQN